MVKRIGDSYAVVHGHPKKSGSERDKPKGTAIKKYSIKKYGKKGAAEKAQKMHYAIVKSQERRAKGLYE